MGNREGLIKAIEGIRPVQSTKDDKWYYTKEQLLQITDAIYENGYGDQIEAAEWGIYQDTNIFTATINRTFKTNFVDFGKAPEMLRVTKLYNQIQNDDLRWRYHAKGGNTEGVDTEVEKILKSAKGYYDINILRGVQHAALAYQRDNLVSSLLRTSYSDGEEVGERGSAGPITSKDEAVNRILGTYLATYPNINENSALHHIFCVYDKDGKDGREWSWKKDDLGQPSPLFKAYQSLGNGEKAFFDQGMAAIQEVCNGKYGRSVLISSATSNTVSLDDLIKASRGREETQTSENTPTTNTTTAAVTTSTSTANKGTKASDNTSAPNPAAKERKSDPETIAFQKRAMTYLNNNPNVIEAIRRSTGVDVSRFSVDGVHGKMTQAVKEYMQPDCSQTIGANNRKLTNEDYRRMAIEGTLDKDYSAAIAAIDTREAGSALTGIRSKGASDVTVPSPIAGGKSAGRNDTGNRHVIG